MCKCCILYVMGGNMEVKSGATVSLLIEKQMGPPGLMSPSDGRIAINST